MTVKASEGVVAHNRVMVYVWQLPVRIIHWAIVVSIGALTISGLIIANGNMGWLAGHVDGMNWTRSLHMAFAWIFVSATIARIIWMFMGNEYSRWDQFVPVAEDRRRGLVETIKYYGFARRTPPNFAGHNPVAGAAYGVMYLLFLVQSFFGMALYGVEHQGTWTNSLTGWIFAMITLPGVRLLHHLLMWVTLVFVIQHLYSMTLVEVEERSGIVSSMLAGTKILPISGDYRK